jgi:uncharacterized protein YbjT (DUF2867 family)
MNRPGSKILAIGAGGPSAGLVVPELVKRGASVRGFVHDAKKVNEVRDRGASEVVVGDLADPISLADAMKGVEGVFYIAPAGLSNEAQVGKALVETATTAGVRRFVFSSLIDPILSAIPHHVAKVSVEEAIIESGMEFAILHPTVFYQNIASTWEKVLETGVFAEPWANETRFSRVDYRDVAEVAAIALTETRLNYGAYELCAEGQMDRFEVAAVMSEFIEKPVRAERLDPSSLPNVPDTLRRMFTWYDSHGLLGNALTLRTILGREPTTLRQYLETLMPNQTRPPSRALVL